MACNCCCTNTLDFCKQGACDSIDFDIKALVPGTHKLITYYLGKKITIEADFEVDEEIIFPLDGLNEDYQYTGEIFDPAGTQILIKKNDIDYDCFKFQTVINVTI